MKVLLDVLKEGAKLKSENFFLAKELVNEVLNEIFFSVTDMLSKSGIDKDGSGALFGKYELRIF